VRSSPEGTNTGTQLRVDLIDGHSAQPIWSEHYDIGPIDFGDSRSAPVFDAYTALLTHVTAEQETASAQAAAAFVRGWHYYGRHELEADRMALAAFTEAIELDPSYGRAHAALAALYWRCWLNRCGAGHHLGLSTWPAARDRAEQHLRHALETPTPLAHQVAARIAMALGRHAEAFRG
jgi:adenylate cyclase